MDDGSHDAARPVYSIGAVSGMLGVPAATLRSWEERYGLVVPDRSSGSQRLYSRDQVEQLRFIADQVKGGLQAGEAHRLLEAERTVETWPGPEDGKQGRRRVLILLAERDPFAAELSEYFLRTEGYEVLIALDAADAAAVSEDQSPQLAVVELMISGTGGTELCEQLSARDITVLATSVLNLRDEAINAGAAAFLPKPFQPLHLVSMVRDLLGTSALTREDAAEVRQ